MAKSEDLKELIRRLSVIDENCYDVVVDLNKIKFHSDEEEMYLEDLVTGNKYNFKVNKDNPRDPVRTNAHRQFCKMVNVPFDFFIENRPPTRNNIVAQWLTAKAPEENDCLVMLRIREGGLLKVIRAILPIDYSAIPLHEVVSTLSKFPEEVGVDTDMDVVKGVERDALLTHVRILFDYDLGGEYSIGLAISSSEVGTSDLIIDSFLYHLESKTYVIAQYGGQPFAKIQYTKVQPSEVQEMINAIPSRIKEESQRYLDTLKAGEDSYPGVERASVLLGKIKRSPTKLKRSIILEAQNSGDDMSTLADFVRHAGLVAKDFDTNVRIQAERVIGSFAGLKYEKK